MAKKKYKISSEHCPTCGTYIGDAETAEMYSMADGEPIKKVKIKTESSLALHLKASQFLGGITKPKPYITIEELWAIRKKLGHYVIISKTDKAYVDGMLAVINFAAKIARREGEEMNKPCDNCTAKWYNLTIPNCEKSCPEYDKWLNNVAKLAKGKEERK